MRYNQKYPWDDLKKPGDSFITETAISVVVQKNIISFAKRRKSGYSVTTKRLPDGRVQVWRK